jgi:hypothetical protein
MHLRRIKHAVLNLIYQKVSILKTDIPVEALLDLDSDLEDVEERDLLSVIRLVSRFAISNHIHITMNQNNIVRMFVGLFGL